MHKNKVFLILIVFLISFCITLGYFVIERDYQLKKLNVDVSNKKQNICLLENQVFN